jgi:predicted  nucleic acid-binding Zn-ribbon protein
VGPLQIHRKGVSLKEGLEKLYRLQLLDDKIRELELSIKEVPETIGKLEQERDGKATIIENTRNKLNENIKEREKLEKEVLAVKDKIKKYKDQMSNATTNKEYQGFMAEIKYEEDNISTLEEKVIEKMVESDGIENEIRESEEEYKKISRDYNQEITDLKQSLESDQVVLEETGKKRDTVKADIPSKFLGIYDNIAGKKYRKAVSLVESDFCGVCNVKIRPQHFNELLSSNEISRCESCGLILYKKRPAAKEEGKENQT